MFCTQTNRIRGLSKNDYNLLREMCRYSNNLYNVGLYNIRQKFFQTGKAISYADNYFVCKSNENFKLLQAGVAQQTLKVASESFKSFMALNKLGKQGEYPRDKVKIPHYRFPSRLEGVRIKEVRIIPVCNGRYFKIQYVFEQKEQNLNLNPDNVLAIDIGLENLTTCISNIGTAFIMDGRKIKSINQYWNKQKAGLQSVAAKQSRESISTDCVVGFWLTH